MNDKIDDGGPAFPCGSVNRLSVGTSDPLFPGMTLRDWFAGMCLTQMISLSSTDNNFDPVATAKGAYDLADAMLETRKK